MEKISKLSVEDSVRAVVHAKRHADPLGKLSISEVCREANVSRATLYAHHRSLIDELFPHTKKDRTTAESSAPSKRADSERELKLENRALLYLCLELRLEVRSLRARLQPYAHKKK